MERKDLQKYLDDNFKEFYHLDAGGRHNLLGCLTVLLREEREHAVREALEMASEEGMAFIGVNDEPLIAKGSIIKLEQKVLDKLRKPQNDTK